MAGTQQFPLRRRRPVFRQYRHPDYSSPLTWREHARGYVDEQIYLTLRAIYAIVLVAYREKDWPKPERLWFWQHGGFRWVPYLQRLKWTVVPEAHPRYEFARVPQRWGLQPATVAFQPMLEYTLPNTLDDTTTTADPGTSGTSLAVTTRTPFPQAGKFYLLVQDAKGNDTNREIMQVTAGHGSGAGSFTVVRGREGTTGVAHASGSYVAAVLVESTLRLSFQRAYIPDTTFYATTALAAAGTQAQTATQAAETAASADGGGVVLLPAFCRIQTTLTLASNVTYSGVGQGVSGFVGDDVASDFITATGSIAGSKTVAVAATYANGERTLMVATPCGFTAGDWVQIAMPSPAFRTFITRVGRVGVGATNDTVTLEEVIPCSFSTATTIKKITFVENPRIQNLTISSPTENCFNQTLRKHMAVNYLYCLRPQLKNVELRGWASDTIGICLGADTCRDVRFEDTDLMMCSDTDPTPTQNTRVMEVRNSTHVRIMASDFHRCGGSAAMSLTATVYAKVSGNTVGGMADWVGGTTDYATTSPTTTSTGSQTLPLTPFAVADNSRFPTAGQFVVPVSGVNQTVSYTGKTGTTSFTGCTGGTGVVPAATVVAAPALATDGGGRGIKAEIGNYFFTISDNNVHDLAFNGIRVSASNYGTVVANNVHSSRDPGISVVADGNVTNGNCTDVIIDSNTVRSTTNSAGVLIQVSWTNSSLSNTYISVTNNVISDAALTTSGQGILLDTNTTFCKANDNIIHDCGTAIRQKGGPNNVVKNNIITGTTGGTSIDGTSATAGPNYIGPNYTDKGSSITTGDDFAGMRAASRVTGDVTLAGTGVQSVTGLSFAIGANERWDFDCTLFIHNASGNTGGVTVAVSVPTSATIKAMAYGNSTSLVLYKNLPISASATLTAAFMAFTSTTVGASFVRITGTVVNSSTAGTVQIQAAEGTNADTNTVEANSQLTAVQVL